MKIEIGEMLKIQKSDDGVIFRVKVQPGAAKNEIVGVQGDALKIKINAPPVKGKANRALVDFLAKKLGTRKSDVEIVSGHTSRVKIIKVVGEGTQKLEKSVKLLRGVLKGAGLDDIREEGERRELG